jgi:hypothetical protein
MGIPAPILMFLVNFGIAYLIMANVMLFSLSQYYNHLNKVYMSLFMASLMGLAEQLIMPGPVESNITLIFVGLALGSLILIRKQVLIGDKQFLKSMVEHHSAAIFMAEGIVAKGGFGKVKSLASKIISEQTKEIEQMKSYLE